MNSIPDRMPFPETPEQMHWMLLIEAEAKHDQCFTHQGINGYMMFGGEIIGFEQGRILVKGRHVEGNRSADDVGVSVC